MSGTAQKPTDRGLGAVRDLHAKLQIEPEWCLSDERGFTWWAKDLAQHIWADPEAKNVNGETFHRLHACTDVFEGFDGSDRQIAVLNALNQNASLSAFLADDDRPGRVQLRCSMLFYPDNAEYVRLVFSTAVALQVAEASITASWFPGEIGTGLTSAKSHHPEGGAEVFAVSFYMAFFLGVFVEGVRLAASSSAKHGFINQHDY